MCGSGGCNGDHGPSAFGQFTQKIAASIQTTMQAQSQAIDPESVARGIVELNLDMGDEGTAAAYNEVMRTEAFAHNMLIGALQMRAGEDPGGCRETTVEELMQQTFTEAVVQVTSQLLHSAA